MLPFEGSWQLEPKFIAIIIVIIIIIINWVDI